MEYVKTKFLICFLILSDYWDMFVVSLAPKLMLRNSNDTDVENNLAKLGWDVWCKMQPIGYDCKNSGLYAKFYYDVKLEDCREVDVGDCEHNINTFDNLLECHETCQDYGEQLIIDKIGPNVYCRLQPDFGGCNSYYPRYYYDMSTRQCKGFSWSGCGGNWNRFTSFQVCSNVCTPYIELLYNEPK